MSDLDRLNNLLTSLQQLVEKREPLTKNIAEILLAGVQDNFLESGREDGGSGTWKPLSAVTLSRRGKRKKNSPVLRVSNRLYQSLSTANDNNTATVGTNVKYAAVHHFGAKKGEFGTYRGPSGTWKPRPIPWGDIPARPYMHTTDREIEEICDFIEEMINKITKEAK